MHLGCVDAVEGFKHDEAAHLSW